MALFMAAILLLVSDLHDRMQGDRVAIDPKKPSLLLLDQKVAALLQHRRDTSALLRRSKTHLEEAAVVEFTDEHRAAQAYAKSFKKLGRTLKFLHIPKTAGTAIELAAGTKRVSWGSCLFNHKPKRTICHYPLGAECTCLRLRLCGDPCCVPIQISISNARFFAFLLAGRAAIHWLVALTGSRVSTGQGQPV
jgi:hypothetical protein